MAKWSIDINELVQNRKEQINEIKKEFGAACLSSVVKKTPVDTGRARSDWNISFPPDNTDQPIIIQNNVEYINVLEYGGYGHYENGEFIPANGEKTKDGWSKQLLKDNEQEPCGMVALTVANQENIFKSVVNKLDRG